MAYIKSQLEAKYAEPVSGADGEFQIQVVVHSASSFEEYYTYDGIDVCGIRVANEIQSQIDALNNSPDGSRVVKLSVAAYSLGGLISRFALGLLYQRGLFETVEPVGFTTFASPHAGALALGSNMVTRMFNKVAPFFLAYTSRQLFLADKSEQPLLKSMSDPSLSFYKALSQFKTLTLYGNVVNDHRTEWYTAGIDTVDPFAHKAAYIRGTYVPGYAPTILDYSKPLQLGYSVAKGRLVPFIGGDSGIAATSVGIRGRLWQSVQKVKVVFSVLVVVPVWFACSIMNSAYQATRAWMRKRQFVRSSVFSLFSDGLDALLNSPPVTVTAEPDDDDTDATDEGLKDRVSENVGVVLESVLDAVSQYSDIDQYLDSPAPPASTDNDGSDDSATTPLLTGDLVPESLTTPPQLSLTPVQRTIIGNLNTLAWTKYAVHIRLAQHSHAAIICRFPNKDFREGKTVIRHWVDDVFVA